MVPDSAGAGGRGSGVGGLQWKRMLKRVKL